MHSVIKSKIEQYLLDDKRSFISPRVKSIDKIYKILTTEEITFFDDFTKEYDDNSRKVVAFITNQPSRHRCVCGSTTKWNSSTNMYMKYCSRKCTWSDNDNIQRIKKETNIKKYGATNVLSSILGKEKAKKTHLEKYGVEHYNKSQEFKDRIASGDISRDHTQAGQKVSETVKRKHYDNVITKHPKIECMFSFEDYKGSGGYNKHLWKCKTCSKEFQCYINYNVTLECPFCAPKGTKHEQLIKDFLTKHNITHYDRYRKLLRTEDGKTKELDFYLPEYNLGIEVHGLYWHSELKIDKNHDVNKLNLCERNGVRLISIFDDELFNKQQIVFNRLKSILGKTKYRLFARKCTISEIPSKIKRSFLNKYHIQGDTHSTHNYGLFYKNRLVAIATFNKTRQILKTTKNRIEGEFELVRYCTVGNFSVVGGCGKLFKHFINDVRPTQVVSYCDRRWSQGNMYKQIGFKQCSISQPNYWYIHLNSCKHRYSRYGFQKHKLKDQLAEYDENLSEHQNMRNNKYAKIFDCGSYKFVYQITQPKP
jgi:G:T-mismatch repair DNA endonuclease (very short patch repair protein)